MSPNKNSSTSVARMTWGDRVEALNITTTTSPPMAATPLTRPDTKPVTRRRRRVGAPVQRKPRSCRLTTTSSSRPMNKRTVVSEV